MHARGSERRRLQVERAAREQEHTRERATRDDELAERRAERAQRMAEREQRMSERDQKMTTRAARRRDGIGHDRRPDPGAARETMAARWAAADAVRRLHPDAAAAWDAAMREAGIDPDGVRRLADAATTARTATPGTDHPDTTWMPPAPAHAAAAEQLAIDFVTDALDQHPAPAGGHHPDPGPAALPRRVPVGIGEAIAAAADGTGADAVDDTPADPAVPDQPGVDAGTGPTPAPGTDAEAGR